MTAGDPEIAILSAVIDRRYNAAKKKGACMRNLVGPALVLAAFGFLGPMAEGHFKLLAPQSWLVESNLGDPQKAGPCGGTSADAGTPSGVINKVQGGQKLHLKLQETVFHPGHYRVALAATRAELPPDSEVATKES